MGTIYEIICWTTGLRYVGSTTQTKEIRLKKHETQFKCEGAKYYSSFLVLEHGNYEIYELEKVNDESKLNEREYYYIQHTYCVNIRCGTYEQKEYKKEWYETNRERRLKEMKEYREANKEKIKEYREANKEKMNEKISCLCGGCYTKVNKTTHEETKKHLKFLNNSTNKDEKESISNGRKSTGDTHDKIQSTKR